MKALVAIVLLAVPLVAQSNTGELRLQVTDPTGLGVKSSVELVSEANHYLESFDTEDAGILVVKRLPFGLYTLTIRQASFATVSQPIEIRSAAPANQLVKLGLAAPRDNRRGKGKRYPHRSSSCRYSQLRRVRDNCRSSHIVARTFRAGLGELTARLAV